MDNQLMLIYNGIEISWFAFFVTVACAAGTAVACVLRYFQKKPVSDIFVLVTFAVPLGMLLARINYCLFSYESIDSLADFLSVTSGGFGLYGAFLGVFAAALIVCFLFGCENLGDLLDCAATGGALAVIIGRFATCFTAAEVGYPVKFRLFTVYDSSQNDYILAVYDLDGLYEACVFIACVWFFIFTLKKKNASGKTALLMLALHGTNQVIMDSMRSDPLKLGINNFIKISQIIGILCCVSVLVYFMVKSAKAKGFGKYHIISIPIILIAIVMGILGEYRVGDSNYISKHLLMFAGMLALNWLTVDFAVRTVDGKSPASEKKAVPSSANQRERENGREKEGREAASPRDSRGMQERPSPARRRAVDETPRKTATPRDFSDARRPSPDNGAPSPQAADRRRASFNRHRESSPSAAPSSVPEEKRSAFNRHRRSDTVSSSSNSQSRPVETRRPGEARRPQETRLPEDRRRPDARTGANPKPIVSSDSMPYNGKIDLSNFNL